MSEIFKRLKEAQERRDIEVVPTLRHENGDEILEGLTKEERHRIVVKLFEEGLTQTRTFRVKGTCPHCKERISLRLRLSLKPKEGSTNAGKVTKGN